MSLEQKELLTWSTKHFSSFLKSFQLPETVSEGWTFKEHLEIKIDKWNEITVEPP